MHELALADAIVSVACEAAGGRRVERVEVKVGHLRQVVPSALEFAFELVAEGTAVEGAELAIEHVPARVSCRTCGMETEIDDFPLACASCGDLHVDVVAGEELLVDALVVVDDEVVAGRR
ncbi:MAG: hydrogenase maturation nickel metallochaperone HypA [Gaiellaceae bacterium]